MGLHLCGRRLQSGAAAEADSADWLMAKVAPHDSPAVYDRHLRVSLPASYAPNGNDTGFVCEPS
jgi:hypothetical protein